MRWSSATPTTSTRGSSATACARAATPSPRLTASTRSGGRRSTASTSCSRSGRSGTSTGRRPPHSSRPRPHSSATIVGRDIPLLAICFGAQVLSHALGGTVSRTDRPEIGWYELDAPDVARGPWMEWHDDVFTVPEGFDVLAAHRRRAAADPRRSHPGDAVPPRGDRDDGPPLARRAAPMPTQLRRPRRARRPGPTLARPPRRRGPRRPARGTGPPRAAEASGATWECLRRTW